MAFLLLPPEEAGLVMRGNIIYHIKLEQEIIHVLQEQQTQPWKKSAHVRLEVKMGNY